MDYSWGVT